MIDEDGAHLVILSLGGYCKTVLLLAGNQRDLLIDVYQSITLCDAEAARSLGNICP